MLLRRPVTTTSADVIVVGACGLILRMRSARARHEEDCAAAAAVAS